MSDFLQIEDEVINGSPKYNITSNGDGTSSITLANEVVHSGTPLNKVGLNRLNEVLGYNECTYTQSSSTSEITFDCIFNRNYASSVLIPGGSTVEIGNITANSALIKTSVRNNAGSNKPTQLYKDTLPFIDKSGAGGLSIADRIDVPSDESIDIIFDNPIMINDFWVYSSGSNVKVKFYKNDTLIYDSGYISSGDARNYTLSNWYEVDYIKFDNYASSARTLRISLTGTKANIVAKTNNITSENYSNFANNQIVNIETPILPTESVVANTFNGKAIDTLLQSNKYYELMYDQPNDRFIAYETRV